MKKILATGCLSIYFTFFMQAGIAKAECDQLKSVLQSNSFDLSSVTRIHTCVGRVRIESSDATVNAAVCVALARKGGNDNRETPAHFLVWKDNDVTGDAIPSFLGIRFEHATGGEKEGHAAGGHLAVDRSFVFYYAYSLRKEPLSYSVTSTFFDERRGAKLKLSHTLQTDGHPVTDYSAELDCKQESLSL